MSLDLAAPRALSAPLGARLYESHFLCAWDPSGGRALWIRYTSLKRAGESARPTVWLTWFDLVGGAEAPVAFRVDFDGAVGAGSGLWSESPLGAIGPGVARGALGGASWDLRFDALAAPVPYLPAGWLYDRPVPRSNGAALLPSASVSGSLEVDGVVVALDGWDATIGHNWGSDHADQWSWIHSGGLGADGRGWLDLTLVRVRLGPVLTPWIAAGALSLDGRLWPPARRPRVSRVVSGPTTSVSVALRGGESLSLEIDAPERGTVIWDYAAPAGPGRTVRNCSVADAVLTLGASRYEIRGRLAVEDGRPAPR